MLLTAILALAGTAILGLPGAAQAGLLSKATAGPGGASAAALDLGDGLVVVGGSRADQSGASWDAVRVGGETVIGKRATPGGAQNQWSGLLADLGPTVDDLNAATCEGEASRCVALLPGSAFANDSSGGANGSLAFVVLSDANGSTGLVVGHSQAQAARRAELGCSVASADATPVAYVINDQVEVVDRSEASHDDC